MGTPSRFREVLQSERVVVAPVRYDPLTARLVEFLGFKVAYLGGFALGVVTCLTKPLTNMVEMSDHALRIPLIFKDPLPLDGGGLGWG
jgi:2-methylisocitrate lyase-like PEP mutase family enzyme